MTGLNKVNFMSKSRFDTLANTNQDELYIVEQEIADDTLVVHKAGTETITGNKTLTGTTTTSQLNSSGLKITNTSTTKHIEFAGTNNFIVTPSGGNIYLNVRNSTNAIDSSLGISSTAVYSPNYADLGTSTYKWKDLYITGNLTNGTNSTTLSNLLTTLNNKEDKLPTYERGKFLSYNGLRLYWEDAAVFPIQTGHENELLKTDGNGVSWTNDVVRTSGDQTIGGVKTFTAELHQKSLIGDSTVAPSSETYQTSYRMIDKNGVSVGFVQENYKPDGRIQTNLVVSRNISGSMVYKCISVGLDTSGNVYTEAPTPANGDNSTKIATTAWCYDPTKSTNLVHRTGDETIAGAKTFNNNITYQKSVDIDWATIPTADKYGGFQINDKNGKRLGKLELFQMSTTGNIGFGLNACGYDSNGNVKYSPGIRTWISKDGNSGWTETTTPATSDNSTKIATTAYVNNRLNITYE